MLADDVAISVRNLTKTYRLFSHPGDRIKQFFSLGLKRYHRGFTALNDVSFDIKKGETVGIIGRNGSGKSTLLQLVCGILKPTSGTVHVNGRISALLELGAGFNPEFTGRENVYFQGALLGFTAAQMDERFDEIAAFADIGEFIDQPVRTYSSGMYVRLAFAAAIHVDPEILVVDEALAVGDRAFQAKCFQRIATLRESGGVILIVTHALEQVAHFCDRALLLDEGRFLADGETAPTLELYLERLREITQESPHPVDLHLSRASFAGDILPSHPCYNPDETRWGDRMATIYNARITQSGRENPVTLSPGIAVDLRYCVRFHADIEHPIYGLVIKSIAGAILFTINSRQLPGASTVPAQKMNDDIEISFTFHPFLECGEYLLSMGVAGDTPTGIQPHDRRYDSLRIHIANPISPTGDIDMNPSFRIIDPA
jgi:lipopolysaccharide transport system ATP-binding protein